MPNLKFNSKFFFFGFMFILYIKFVILFIVLSGIEMIGFGGGSDANVYHAYAIGHDVAALNIWPLILRWLNNNLIYSKGLTVFALIIISSIIIPFITFSISSSKTSNKGGKLFWMCMFIVGAYPTLFFYSLDVYRDSFMLLALIIGLFFIKKIIEYKKTYKLIVPLLGAILINSLLYSLRGYLGAAFTGTVIFCILIQYIKFDQIRFISFKKIVLFYLFLTTLLYQFGIFEALTEYRDDFQNYEGGSNLGITFTSSLTFIPNFILSTLYQLFGLWLFNAPAIFTFITESLPFTLFISFIIKNKSHTDELVWAILVFVFLYNTTWLIANDNLGTAVRLRLLCYVPVIAAFFRVQNNVHASNNLC